MAEWHKSEITYLAPSKVVCELCGQLIPGRFWRQELAGQKRVFCNPDHAHKYEAYWLPRYGQATSR